MVTVYRPVSSKLIELFSCTKRVLHTCNVTHVAHVSLSLVPIVTQSHTGLHERPIQNSTHELAKLSSLFSAFRKCLKLQNWWYQNVLLCL